MSLGGRLAAGAVAAVGVGVAVGARAVRSGRGSAGRAPWSGAPEERRDHRRGITIMRPPEEVYRFWRDLPRLGAALDQVTGIDVLDEHRSRWRVTGPAGTEISFTARIMADVPGSLLAWRTEDSPLPHEGRVEFLPAPGDRGTEVRVSWSDWPAADRVGNAVATVTGHTPDHLVRGGLRRIKQLLECGEVVRVDGQPTGRSEARERTTRLLVGRATAGGRP